MEVRFVKTLWYVNGTLPFCIAQDAYEHQFGLLPCNPAKQADYPTFIGYLKVQRHRDQPVSQWDQYGITQTSDGPSIPEIPGYDSKSITQVVDYLMRMASGHGHKFPDKPAELSKIQI
jgi:hypothetical protein